MTMVSDEQAVIEKLREAALDGDRWIDALDALARVTGARSANLVGVKPGVMAFDWASNVDPQLWLDLDATMRGDPLLNPRVLNGIRSAPMEVFSGVDYASDNWTRRFPEYGEACRRYDVGGGSQAVLHRSTNGFVGIATLRSAREGHATDEQNETFARLAPHVLDAVRLQSLIEGRAASFALGTLDAISAVAFLCDETGKVRGMTRAAEDLVSSSGLLALRQGRLVGWCDPATEQLSASVWSAIHRPDQPMQTLILRQEDGPPVRVEVASLPCDAWSMTFHPRVIVTVKPRSLAELPGQICAAFGLTPAEAEITLLVVKGVRRGEIAEQRGVSAETVKSQLKAIFGKLGVTRESEIAALLGGL